MPESIRDFCLKPLASRHLQALVSLPAGIETLARLPSALMIHRYIAPAYGETLSETRIEEQHLRAVDAILDEVMRKDCSPLDIARRPPQRTVGVCRHFSLLLAAMLRAKGVPARPRCGFAAYFEKGRFVDHWVCEAWHGGRWRLIDPQLDEVQRKAFAIAFDPLDVPRDRFLVAAEAWTMCRAGKAKPDDFGILEMAGWWFIAGNLVRDLAALNGVVMLPWDVWEPMPQEGEAIDVERFDRLAAVTADPDAHWNDVRALYESDCRVPPLVFNALRQRMEQA